MLSIKYTVIIYNRQLVYLHIKNFFYYMKFLTGCKIIKMMSKILLTKKFFPLKKKNPGGRVI